MISSSWFYEHGSLGVDVFFGISGLLICSRLMTEEQERGKINLLGFYVRRSFRILPPLLLYLICAGILGAVGIIPLAPKEWLASLLFCRNYSFLSQVAGHVDWYTAHLWSLAVEEHFYLLLPLLLVVLPRSWRLSALASLAAVVVLWRVYQQRTRPWADLAQHTDTRLDALLIPAICAILLTQPQWSRVISRIAKVWPLWAAILIYFVTTDEWPVLGRLAEPSLITLVLFGTISSPGALISRILELAPLRWVGKLSYSFYLWQQMFFVGHFSMPLGIWQSSPLKWVMVLACGTVSYYFVERPLIRLGHTLVRRLGSASDPNRNLSIPPLKAPGLSARLSPE
jgi:peptidoglycan/LPS O-acetylase OafA/YrhL